MKIKVGSKLYDSDKQLLMVILSGSEKSLISNMAPDAHKFCVYPPGMNPKKIETFMDDENENRKRP